MWEELEISIGEIPDLLDDYDIEVTSPDGWVAVTEYVDKGLQEEYVLEANGKQIRCSGGHLFETTHGWLSTSKLLAIGEAVGHLPKVLCADGEFWDILSLRRTGDLIPIVDIVVDHDNHRYYTDGISSHNTGVGKSLIMCHMAAANLSLGKNVLYISMEMAKERIGERIDANLLNTPLDELNNIPKDVFLSKIAKLKQKTVGKLVIEEYPTSCAGSANFRHLLRELKIKKNFVPDIIYIDYLNICASSRIKNNGSVNSYTYIKAIAEELRGLAVEHNLPIVSATQTNRNGMNNSDIDITDTSESIGLTHTVDFMFAVIATEELLKLNQFLIIQLKNRYADLMNLKRFVIGVDKSRMKLYSVEESAQQDLVTSRPSNPISLDNKDTKSRFDKNKFAGFK